ncbi:hypothetical protein N0V93_004593 [Gnomoniopsis smithogilvyi]|uniref:Aminotransferase class I/classII large domain-containing protein n=1 Tax=Gnomoniopsis smithogilvyi TaxID=1191159 RepID=A0A9W9CXA6_9PEZI|nr:hypothetical protein N0V93_004593 [Gnomoniopsis smithogilvyi]
MCSIKRIDSHPMTEHNGVVLVAEPIPSGLSRRGWSNVQSIMPRIKGAVQERSLKHSDKIDLSTAENWLIRPELVELCKASVGQLLEEKHFSYSRGFAGDPDLMEALASFFNKYFSPYIPVLPAHIATAPGATASIDALLYNICEPGDGVLLPSPYWNGFDFGIRVRSSVVPVLVTLGSHGANFSDELLPALEKAYNSAQCQVRALLITNPHNPLALCYPRDTLESCVKFCAKHNLHLISDEVYALSTFPSPDVQRTDPFVSVLSLDLDCLEAKKSQVHTVWSTSKDFGQSGIRMGCTITQFNREMAVGLALAANTQISVLTSIFVTSLLSSPDLPSLIALNSERLASAYKQITTFFKNERIAYLPCNAGLYLYVKLVPYAVTWDDEANVVSQFREAGVLVSPGRAFHGPDSEKGWVRMGFAVHPIQLQEAIKRMKRALGTWNQLAVQ